MNLFMKFKRMFKRTPKIWSHNLSPDLLHKKVRPGATYSPWLNDHDFKVCYEQIKEHTLVDIYRCYELWSLAKQMKNVEGCFLEVGVWRGGTGSLLAKAAKLIGKTNSVFLADTFEGVVKTGGMDTVYVGKEHADTSMQTVLTLLSSMQIENAKVLKGIFPDETSHHLSDQKIALLHCDVDVYQSSKDIIEWALPRISPGGLIIFDDYGFYGCEGVTRYVHELLQDPDFLFLHNLNGHAVFIKKAVLPNKEMPNNTRH